MMRSVIFAALAAALLSLTTRAHATPNFPGAIQAKLKARAKPDCIVCHNNPLGGLGTVTTPFGMYMRSRGLSAYDEASLANALAAAQGEMHDSDADGVIDIDALTDGLDPNGVNSGDGGIDRPSPPAYGCDASVVRPRHGRVTLDARFSCGAFAALLLVVRFRRRVRVARARLRQP